MTDLRSLGRQVGTGSITWTMLPFTPVAVQVRLNRAKQVDDGGNVQVRNALLLFAIFDPVVVDAVAVEHEPEAEAVVLYVHSRSGDFETDWLLFQQLIGSDAMDWFWTAYNSLRQSAVHASEALQQGKPEENADPEAFGAGSTNPAS
jgi:hypothetical protein